MALDWTVHADHETYTGGDIHCTPNNDLIEHILETYCPCEPEIAEETERGRVVVHQAFDEREIIESIYEEED